ncbi:hypothetical protein EDB86DRAFT_3243966 [Lactarius hatsudake]|nr:hypothetical protein EDB86DRAFT_3243966 [Lactarius hatsudake]
MELEPSLSVTSGSSHELFFVKAFILLRKKSHKSHHFSMSRIGELWGRNVGYGIVTFMKGEVHGAVEGPVGTRDGSAIGPVPLEQTSPLPRKPLQQRDKREYTSHAFCVPARDPVYSATQWRTEDQHGQPERISAEKIPQDDTLRQKQEIGSVSQISVTVLAAACQLVQGRTFVQGMSKYCRWGKAARDRVSVSNNDLIANLYYLNCTRDNISIGQSTTATAARAPGTLGAAHDLHFNSKCTPISSVTHGTP